MEPSCQIIRYSCRADDRLPETYALHSVGHLKLRSDETAPCYEATNHTLIVVWVLKGSLHIESDGFNERLKPRHVAVLTPPFHCFARSCSAETEVRFFSIDGHHVDEACRNYGLRTGLFFYPSPPLGQFELLASMLEGPASDQMKQAKSAAISLLRNIEAGIMKYSANRRLETAIRIIVRKLDDPAFGVEQLAQEMGINRKGLYLLFREEKQLSPQQFIRKLKMHRICLLLRYTSIPLSQLPRTVGFSSTASFNRAFRNYFGKLPSEFMAAPECSACCCPPAIRKDLNLTH